MYLQQVVIGGGFSDLTSWSKSDVRSSERLENLFFVCFVLFEPRRRAIRGLLALRLMTVHVKQMQPSEANT